jgi:hypothetical protein
MARPALHLTPTVDEFHSIDIAWLRRRGTCYVGYFGSLRWTRHGQETGSIGYTVEREGLRLRYRTIPRLGGMPRDVNELVPIVTTPTNFGGVQHWFLCLSCRRRCRIIYGGSLFRCRRCCGARYESQYRHPALTICDRRWAIRRRLEERGSSSALGFGLDDGLPLRPKGMHWRTYRRLKQLDDRLAGRWWCGVNGFLERLDRQTFNGKASPRRR